MVRNTKSPDIGLLTRGLLSELPEVDMSLYAYCANNPVGSSDFLGLKDVLYLSIIILRQWWVIDSTGSMGPSGEEWYGPYEYYTDVDDCYIIIDTHYKRTVEFHWYFLFVESIITKVTEFEWGPDPSDPCCK